MDINETVEYAHEMAKSKGWHDKEVEPLIAHMKIVTEIAEASESVSNNEPDSWVRENGKPEGEQVELADAVIRIMDYFGLKGWNLEETIQLKMDYNAGRSYRHGGKKF